MPQRRYRTFEETPEQPPSTQGDEKCETNRRFFYSLLAIVILLVLILMFLIFMLYMDHRHCGKGWVYFSKTGFCYKMENENTTFRKAEERCRSWNSHLVSIHSTEENNFLEFFPKLEVKSHTWPYRVWIGVRYKVHTPLINYENEDEQTIYLGSYHFTDGTNFDYALPPVSVHSGNGTDVCFSFDPYIQVGEPVWLFGSWHTQDCDQDLADGYVCKKKPELKFHF